MSIIEHTSALAPRAYNNYNTWPCRFDGLVMVPRTHTLNFPRLGPAPSGAGEVIVHRGPAALQGCKVRIWGNKTRGPTWDFDRCYVQILDVATSALAA